MLKISYTYSHLSLPSTNLFSLPGVSHQLNLPCSQIFRHDCLETYSMPCGNSKSTLRWLYSQEASCVFWSELLFFLSSQVDDSPGKILGAAPSSLLKLSLQARDMGLPEDLRVLREGLQSPKAGSSNFQSSSLITNCDFPQSLHRCPVTPPSSFLPRISWNSSFCEGMQVPGSRLTGYLRAQWHSRGSLFAESSLGKWKSVVINSRSLPPFTPNTLCLYCCMIPPL